ncbi:MAG: host specificity protein, partial [Lentisphaeria bacterium]|nr:host specificity protein [Lentisphaeria bacterium]
MDINNLEKFKAKMASGRMCVGTVITLSDPAVSELAGDAGMDFTWIDAEHAPHTIESVMGHIMALRGTDCA